MKCIKHKCKYYFNSDNYIEMCKLVNDYCVSGECLGIKEIRNTIESIGCDISKLMNEYKYLIKLENYISNNQ